jgi:hypothetical protein
MIIKRVRVFGTPAGDDTFRACITEADNVNVVLHMGTTKRSSLAEAITAGASTAQSKGWIVVAPNRTVG